ncbi:MAG: hypothetical protein IJ497_11810, partial [Clostridia bacterium]|nr:hypothetical protein [Clostridia bacterium]
MQFEPIEQWIWLPQEAYPANQTTLHTTMYGNAAQDGNYTVVRCEKQYRLNKPIQSVHIRTSGDTFFRLYVNGIHRITGPASVGGDFLTNERVRSQHYANELTFDAEYPGLNDGILDFSAV